MQLTVKGKSGDDAEIAVSVTPEKGSNVFKGDGEDIEKLKTDGDFQKIGVFPLTTTIFFFFHRRPWSFDILQKGGAIFSHSSEDENLNNAILTRPDVVSLSLNYDINP